MNANFKRFVPFALGASMILMLTALLATYRYELQMNRENARALVLLDGLGKDLSAELNLGADAVKAAVWLEGDPAKIHSAVHSSKWHLWRFTAGDADYFGLDASAPRIALQTLQRDLPQPADPSKPMILIGPYATEMNLDAFVLATAMRGKDGRMYWWGASILANELVPLAALADFVKQGFRLQLVDAASGIVLFQSDTGEIHAPVSVPIQFTASALQLHAAPRNGWTMRLGGWAPSLFLLLTVCTWLSYELRRWNQVRAAAEDLAEAESRRQQASLLYGEAIENVAVLESRLQVVSLQDNVTGLSNRTSLLHKIESGLAHMRDAQSGTLGLLAIGLDHLEHIGNSFGTEFASRVLVVAAERVEFVLPSREMLYRTGDANFAVVLVDPEPRAALMLADRIIKEIEAPISMDSHTFLLHPSVGIAETTSGYHFVESLLDQANTALGAAQHATTTRRCVFDSATAKESVRRLQLEVDLIRAFDEQQFVLEFEPIMMPATNGVAGFEALIRWNHPTEGRLGPGAFVPIVQQAGLSHRLDRWVLRQAALRAKAWRRAGRDNLFVSFNLSAEAFLKPDLEIAIGEALAEFELPGNHLSIELTEATLIQDVRGAARTLQRLNEFGIQSWLDDFGTGYSSLSHLRELPLTGVKIDPSFIKRTAVDARDFGFLKSLVDLISYLGLKSIAEGVETQEQHELLGMTTCDYYQGHYFSQSMTAEEVELWMNDTQIVTRREAHA